jgi:hypothetical protein
MGLSAENYEKNAHLSYFWRRDTNSVDRILDQEFFISKRTRIDYKKREIIMGDVRLKFDEKILSGEQV